MHKAMHAALPATLDLRLVKVCTNNPGFRTQELQVITTLRDSRAHNAAQIAAWYQRRWQVELCFDDIKTSLRMHALRCKSPHMVARELLMHMIAYNLVRHLIACAEPMREIKAKGTLSFKGTMDRLDQWQWVALTLAQPTRRTAPAATNDACASLQRQRGRESE